MENFLREGVAMDIGNAVSSKLNGAGDAHYFEDSTTPAKVRQWLDSIKVGFCRKHKLRRRRDKTFALLVF
jgi:hypothetical protein